jgi:hypothetical protein
LVHGVCPFSEIGFHKKVANFIPRQAFCFDRLLVSLTPEFTQLIKMKAMDSLAGLGLKIKELEIHAIEDGGAPSEGM